MEKVEDNVKEILSIPQNYRVECMISIGYPDEEKTGHDIETLKFDKVHYNNFKGMETILEQDNMPTPITVTKAPSISFIFIFSLKTNTDKGIMVTGVIEVMVDEIPAEVYCRDNKDNPTPTKVQIWTLLLYLKVLSYP